MGAENKKACWLRSARSKKSIFEGGNIYIDKQKIDTQNIKISLDSKSNIYDFKKKIKLERYLPEIKAKDMIELFEHLGE